MYHNMFINYKVLFMAKYLFNENKSKFNKVKLKINVQNYEVKSIKKKQETKT